MTWSWNDGGQWRKTEQGVMAERKRRVPKVVNENKSLSDEECCSRRGNMDIYEGISVRVYGLLFSFEPLKSIYKHRMLL